uniref:Uncharacterized protein n=1 Tax=Curvibacter symbiont subsp. Hydra magnipapillata TaxID=667019 RepID=C9YFG1_CURXX|nr:hypothetical protein Csp_D33170 [Curvibacter putative symbiont of Hydra magnipapillata]
MLLTLSLSAGRAISEGSINLRCMRRRLFQLERFVSELRTYCFCTLHRIHGPSGKGA